MRKRRPMVALLVLGDRVRATACVCKAGARNEKVVIRNSAPRCGGRAALKTVRKRSERESLCTHYDGSSRRIAAHACMV